MCTEQTKYSLNLISNGNSFHYLGILTETLPFGATSLEIFLCKGGDKNQKPFKVDSRKGKGIILSTR